MTVQAECKQGQYSACYYGSFIHIKAPRHMLYKQTIKRRFAYKRVVSAISRTSLLLLFIVSRHITLMRLVIHVHGNFVNAESLLQAEVA